MITQINDGWVLAKEAAKSIANHYSQEIHFSNNEALLQQLLPYFDPLHGKPLILTQITKHWTDKLNENTSDEDTFFHIVSGLIDSYDKCIREKCFSVSKTKNCLEPTCAIVLMQYEQLLSSYLTTTIDNENVNMIEIQSVRGMEILDIMYSSVESVVLDIFSLTAVNSTSMHRNGKGNEGEKKSKSDPLEITALLNNVILPTLLRILQHYISVQHRLLLRRQRSQNPLELELELEPSEFEKYKYILTITTLAALSFYPDDIFIYGDGKNKNKHGHLSLSSSSLTVSEILPNDCVRTKELSLRHIFFHKNSYPPSILSESESSESGAGANSYLDGIFEFVGLAKGDDSFMGENIVDLGCESAMLSMPWLDHTKGIGARAGRSLLQSLGTLLAKPLESYTCKTGKEQDQYTNSIISNESESIVAKIISIIGEEYAAQAIREIFFGRHPIFRNSEMIRMKFASSESIAFNGIPEVKKDDNIALALLPQSHPNDILLRTDDELYSVAPARIPSVVRFLGAFKFPLATSTVLDHTLPIIFTLIDSTNESHQSIGASLLIHLFTESTTTSIQLKGRATSIEQILSIACRACNSSVPLSLLWKARCQLFEFLPNNKDSNKFRQGALSDSFMWIHKNSYQSENYNKVCGVLVCSVQPLLEQLGKSPDANAIEVGRLGLTTLLPLIRWDSKNDEAKRVQIAAITCLISLVFGAHPIMPRHGGKIMSELIACFCRSQRDLEIYDKITDTSSTWGHDSQENIGTKNLMLALSHAASVALIICGNRANDVIVKVEEGQFSIRTKEWCELVRRGGIAMENQLSNQK